MHFILDFAAVMCSSMFHCCIIFSNMQYKKGSVTMFGLNVNPLAAVSISFTGSLVKEGVDVYLLEPDGPKGVLSK